MTWIAVLTMFVGMYASAAVFERYRRRDTDQLRERLAELEVRLADALPAGDPYRKKVLPMLEPARPHVYCEDCRFNRFSPNISKNICLAHPVNGQYAHIGQKQTNAGHDCVHFQKRAAMSKKRRPRRAPFGSVTITDGVKFTCPFCKAECMTSLEHCAVLHTEPMCWQFEHLGPVEFLKAVNERLAN